jgi:hypothetical protein
MQGLVTVRAYQLQQRARLKCERLTDASTRASWPIQVPILSYPILFYSILSYPTC